LNCQSSGGIGATYTCVACGGQGESCCAGQDCNSGLRCTVSPGSLYFTCQ
jgi:hypothetical protein